MKKTYSAGFTLVELLIALAVAAILLSVAAPSVKAVLLKQRLQGALGPVSFAVLTARSEAARSGDSVTVCARATDSQCGTDWNNGLLVFRDGVVIRNETTAVRDSTDEILRIVAPHGHEVMLKALASTDRTAASAYSPNFVRYEPDGQSDWKSGTFYVCDARGDTHAQALHITLSGDTRPARRPESSSATTVKNVFGVPISCNSPESETG